ncbi:MAG: 30S ribosomal protein S14, partial [Pseudomonadota bacterium]
AKASMIERQKKRERLVKKYAAKRAELKEQLQNRELALGERVQLAMKLADLPRNSSPTRLNNRCLVTGRPKAYYGRERAARRKADPLTPVLWPAVWWFAGRAAPRSRSAGPG